MAARAIWRGQIRLALVSIPVELFPATKSGAQIQFHQVHEPSGKRIKYEKVVPGIGPVDRDEIVKGYEVSKGHYVLLDPEEIDSVKLESRKTLDLVQFVDEDEIDPTFFDKPYYVVPADDLAEEAYVVLRDALKAAKKVGVGQLAMRGQEYVVALKPCGRGLLLETLRYADEIHKSSGFFRDIGDTKPDPDLLDMASMLIERKAGEFDPNEFHNRYVDALHRLIEEKQKAKGEKIIEDPDADAPPPKGSNVIDLMAALKKSLGDEEAGKAGEKAAGQEDLSQEGTGEGACTSRGVAHGRRKVPLDIETYNRKRDFAKTKEPRGPQAQGQGRQLRRPEARRVAAALGLPARARRRPQELGGAQRPEPRPRREPPRHADRGPSARLRRLRRHHPQGRIWRRHGDAVGPGPLDPRPAQGSEQDHRGGPPPLHARRRPDEGRMGDVPAEAQARREGRAMDAEEGHRRLSPIPKTATRWSTIA